jgi:DNA-binding MarR family transcriptional regulator
MRASLTAHHLGKSMGRSPLKLTDRLPFLINRVGAALASRFTAEVLAERNLTIPIYRVLSVLSDYGPLRQVDVRSLTSIEASTLSRLIGRMVRRGLVSKTRSRMNDRDVILRLTPRGAITLQPLREIGLKLDALAMEGLSPKEIDALKGYLRHIYGNISKAMDGNRLSVAGATVRSQTRKASPLRRRGTATLSIRRSGEAQ